MSLEATNSIKFAGGFCSFSSLFAKKTNVSCHGSSGRAEVSKHRNILDGVWMAYNVYVVGCMQE